MGWEGISFCLFLCFFGCLFVFLSFTFVKFLRRHIVIFTLKFILGTSVLCLLYVYIENKIKTINLKKTKNKKKNELNTIGALISKDLIDSCISHAELASVNNVLKKCNEMKEAIKNHSTFDSDNKYARHNKKYQSQKKLLLILI